MTRYQYRILPAPEKGKKAKGVKGAKARFAHAVEELMNEMGADGWEYLRADTLPSEERAGLGSSVTEWRTLLVFRRPRLDRAEDFAVPMIEGPDDDDENESAPLFPAKVAASAPEKPDADAKSERDPEKTSTGGLGALLRERAGRLIPASEDRPDETEDEKTASEDDKTDTAEAQKA